MFTYILIDCMQTVDILNRYTFMGFDGDSFLISIEHHLDWNISKNKIEYNKNSCFFFGIVPTACDEDKQFTVSLSKLTSSKNLRLYLFLLDI